MKKIKCLGRYLSQNENGSITSIVLATLFFFIITLSAAYMLIASTRRKQLKSELLLKNMYDSQILQANSIAEELLK